MSPEQRQRLGRVGQAVLVACQQRVAGYLRTGDCYELERLRDVLDQWRRACEGMAEESLLAPLLQPQGGSDERVH